LGGGANKIRETKQPRKVNVMTAIRYCHKRGGSKTQTKKEAPPISATGKKPTGVAGEKNEKRYLPNSKTL